MNTLKGNHMLKFLIPFALIINNSYAQEAAGSMNPIASFAPFIAIAFIFYFLVIKPQKKQLEDEKSMLETLSKGDEVYTKAGILGTIVGMTEKIVTLEVNESTKLKVLRTHVGGLSSKLFEKKDDKKVEKKGK
jgi:preprotein translocase subunit YajC